MTRRLREWLSRGEMPDPVDDAFATVADWYADHPQDAAEKFADEVEHWLCTNYCNHKEN